MKIALYEELNKAFEDYNAQRSEDKKMCWFNMLDNIEDKESEKEISQVIQILKRYTKGVAQ